MCVAAFLSPVCVFEAHGIGFATRMIVPSLQFDMKDALERTRSNPYIHL